MLWERLPLMERKRQGAKGWDGRGGKSNDIIHTMQRSVTLNDMDTYPKVQKMQLIMLNTLK
jgi:hypothetical protein